MTIGALAEPALLVAVIALSIQSGTSNLPVHRGYDHDAPQLGLGSLAALALVALVIVVIAETGRLPVDNPSTHLELTMIHEAMILEYAGPELALVTLGASMRLALLFSLIANLFFPWGIATSGSFVGLALGAVVLVGKTAVVGVRDFSHRDSKRQVAPVPPPRTPRRRFRALGARGHHRTGDPVSTTYVGALELASGAVLVSAIMTCGDARSAR